MFENLLAGNLPHVATIRRFLELRPLWNQGGPKGSWLAMAMKCGKMAVRLAGSCLNIQGVVRFMIKNMLILEGKRDVANLSKLGTGSGK